MNRSNQDQVMRHNDFYLFIIDDAVEGFEVFGEYDGHISHVWFNLITNKFSTLKTHQS